MAKKKPKRASQPSSKKKGNHSRPQTVAMFNFSPEEIENAIDVLAGFYQDHPMEREMMRIKSHALIGELQKRGLTLALAERQIDELVRAGAYFKGKRYAQWRTWVSFDGSQQIDTDSQEFWHLYTTRNRLRTFFAKRQLSAARGPINEFRRKGEFWELAFQWKTVYIADMVGLAYIAQLLRDPGRTVPVVFLQAAQAGVDPVSLSGSSGEILDDEARQRYWMHYGELQSELEAANAANDVGRTEALQGELDHLERELLRGCGLGGRSRRQSDAEKSRKAVSLAVNRAIEKIKLHHEPLSTHLLNSISSGHTFCYSPDTPIGWLL